MDGMYPYKSFVMELLEILSSWYILSFCVLSFMQTVIWESSWPVLDLAKVDYESMAIKMQFYSLLCQEVAREL